MIRGIDENFVSVLKERIENDPSSPGVPPLAVLCTSHTVRDFHYVNVHVHVYFTCAFVVYNTLMKLIL